MVFVKRDKREEQSFNVGVTMGHRKPVTGIVGLEIECEGNKFKKEGLPEPWEFHQDGSLRGRDNAEYVLKAPVSFDAVTGAVDGIYGMMKSFGTVLDESNRTSIHVHLNVQPFFLNRLTSLMALYFTFEEVLTGWCGEHRVGNLFCLRAKDAPAIISQMRRFIRSNMQAQLRDNNHYAGMNGNAIHKLGSLEFRTLRGVNDPEVIKQWVGILRRLYTLSADFQDPREICYSFSAGGPLMFFDNILGDQGPIVRNGIAMDNETIKDSMYEGIRMAQDLCFARDWSLFKGVEFKPDPFGRDAKSMIKRVQSAGAETLDIEAALDQLAVANQATMAATATTHDPFGGTHFTDLAPLEPEPMEDMHFQPSWDEED